MMEIQLDTQGREGPIYDPKPRPRPFRHAEAFVLMQYHCEACGAVETLWNSRDGITPFGVECPTPGCTGTTCSMKHVNWSQDRCVPHYQPSPVMRVFANITLERAAECARQRAESAVGTQYEIAAEEREAFIARLAADIYGDGTGPMVISGEEWHRQRVEAAIRMQAEKTEVARRAGMFGPRHNGHQAAPGHRDKLKRRRKLQKAARKAGRR
jgi:hypothetical protein